MAKPPIEIGIAEDGEAFRKGIKADVIKPLEDAEEALTDLGKSKGPERLERELEVAQERTEDLRKETKKTAAEIDDAYRQSSAKAKDSFKGAGDAAADFKTEARANFAEVVSSFDGDMSSIQDLAQGTLGGIAGSMTGPLAAAAGIGAIAVGLIGTAIEGLSGNAEATKEAVTEQFREMAQSGIDEWSSAQATIDRMTDAYADHGDEIRRISDEIGVPAEVVGQAWAGVPDAIELVTAKYAQLHDAADKFYNDNRVGAAGQRAYAELHDLESAMKPLQDVIDITGQGLTQAREFSTWTDSYLRGVLEAAGKAQLEVDEIGNRLFTLEDGTEILVDVDTRQATLNVDKFKGDLDDIPESISTRLTILKPEPLSVLQELQRGFDRGALRITADVYTRDGQRVS